MSDSTGHLPTYSECEHSLFISYAHADDDGNNGWVEALSDTLQDRLNASLPRDIVRRRPHLSGDNGPSAGHLEAELRDRIGKSFAMLLVIGDRYVDSAWCERELELFTELFGSDGTKSRLLVAVMSEAALVAVKQRAVWKQNVAPDQVFVLMYDKRHPTIPVPAKSDNGDVSQALHNATQGIAERLVKQIISSVANENATPNTPSPVVGSTSSKRLSIAIAPCTTNLTKQVNALRDALNRSGAAVTVLDRELVLNYDPNATYPWGKEFAAADALIAPISELPPLRPDIDGGHVTLLRHEWAKLKKKRPIVWYQPADVVVAPMDRAEQKHQNVFKQLDPIYASDKAVVNHLFATGHTLRVYIEKHKQEPAFWISDELNDAWKALPPDPSRPANLDCSFMELAQLSSLDGEAAAVILLMPEGLKDPSSLKSQMELVREKFPSPGGLYPGVVVCLFNPPPQVRPGLVHDWAEVHFYRKEDDRNTFQSDADNKRWLSSFAQLIWNKYKINSAGQIH